MNPFKKTERKYIEDIIALTPMQEGMLFHYLKNPESDHYFEQLCLDISGTVDIEIFKKAWNFVIEENEMLRVLFQWEKLKNPVQVTLKEYKIQLEYYDFSDRVIREGKKCLEELKINDRAKKFDLWEVPFRITLCKVEKDKYAMIISNHHILYDGWSNGIILREFFNAYTDFVDLKEPEKPVKTKFKEFVKWIQDQDTEKQEKFWSNYLKGFDTQRDLSIKKRRKGKEPPETKNFQISFTKDIKRELERFVKRDKLTLASLLYSVWGILLQKYNNTDDVVFGTTVSGRSAKVQGIEEMVGLFINTLPLRVQSNPGEKIEDLLYKIDHSLQQREEHEAASLVNIKEFSELNNNEELFDSIVVIENYPLGNRLIQEKGKLSIDSYSMVEMTHYDLTIGITIIEEIEISFIYNEGVFDSGSIKNMSRHFLSITEDIIKHPDKEVSDIEIVSEDEKKRLLFGFNNTDADYPKDKTIHQLFEEQVEKTGDRVAVIGMPHAITYNELNKKSDQLAYSLKEKGVRPEDIVGIMVERSIEMIIGIFGILKAGGAYMPIDPNYPENRIKYMLADSSTGILLTSRNLSERIAFEKEIIYLDSCKRFGPVGASSEKRHAPCSRPHASQVSVSLAYVIYTSGSTGRPKGVLVEQGSLVNTIYWRKQEYNLGTVDKVLQLFSFSFDGFVTSFFTPIVSGSAVVLLTDEEPRDIFRIKEVIVTWKITHFICVPSLYASLLELCSPAELSRLRMVTLAGEPIKPAIVEKSKKLNSQLEVINEYGATENTVVATICRDLRPGMVPGRAFTIPIGKPMANTKIFILDLDDHIVPVGIPGQLCIAGKGLARGYLNRPELTTEKFDHDFQDYQDYQDKNKNKTDHDFWDYQDYQDEKEKAEGSHHSALYRTGDLARWLEDGNIEFLGRIDYQVKIRGFRVELGEIENQLLNYEDIKAAVVIAREEKNSETYLCAYVVPRAAGTYDFSRLNHYLQRKLPGYMVPAHFVSLAEVPLTVSGKVDRKSLPQPEIVSPEKYIAPRNEVEKTLVDIWSEVLGIEKEIIGIDANFFRLGGHSLKAAALAARIHKILNVKIPLSEVFQLSTIRNLAEYINGAANVQYTSIEAAKEKEYYALSSAQRRLYILHQVNETSTRFNMSTAMRIEGAVDKKKLENTFKQLIRRNENFRTSFEMKGNEPVQVIHQNEAFGLEYFDLAGIGKQTETEKIEKQVVKNFFKGFDLSGAPLLRACLIKTAEEKYILMVDMHHIISDEASVELLEREFWALYVGEELPELKFRYRDFSEWQNRLLDSHSFKKQEQYWLSQFKESIPVLHLPLDFPRPSVIKAEGSRIYFELDREITTGVTRLVMDTETTTFMVLIAIYNVLLSKYSGQEDIVVGSPIAGRRHLDLKDIIGLFVNILPIRNQPKREKTFREFLQDVKVNALNVYENQEYPFERLVWNLQLKVDPSRSPLFDVVFVLRDAKAREKQMHRLEALSGINIRPYEVAKEQIHNELILEATEGSNTLSMVLEYSTELFEEATARKMCKHYAEILEQVLENPDIKLEDIRVSYGLSAVLPDVFDTVQDEGQDFRF